MKLDRFVPDEFRLFVAQNGIKHITSAPYHPRTYGQAERLVQVFKKAMRSAKEDHVSLQQKLSTCVCGVSPQSSEMRLV